MSGPSYTYIKIPHLPAKEVLLARFCVAEGDRVERHQIIAIVQSDEMTFEIQNNYCGWIRKLILFPDDIAVVGDEIALMDFGEVQVGPQPSEDYRVAQCRWSAIWRFPVETIKRMMRRRRLKYR